jgi:hypothetical protein
MRIPIGLALAALATLSLAGCATLPQAISVVGSASTVITYAQTAWSKAGLTLFDVEATYGVIQTAAVNFERAECPHKVSRTWCPALHDKLAAADAKVRAAFDKGEAFIKAHPTLSPSAVIAAAESAVNAVATLADHYGAKL